MGSTASDWKLSTANQLVSGINSALAMAPGAQKHLKNLEQCVLKIQLTGINSAFYFGVMACAEADAGSSDTAQNNSTALTKYTVQLVEPRDNPDVLLSGSPLSFIKLIGLSNKARLFQNKELDLQGNSVRIQQILAFIQALEIDWDGLLANFIGDVPAHFVGTTLRSGLTWGINFSQAFMRDAEEYIKYELRLLPDKLRASKQFSAISDLAKDVDAFKSRIDRFEKNISS
jgi:ubiquinone biosynthesis protein UbiJ